MKVKFAFRRLWRTQSVLFSGFVCALSVLNSLPACMQAQTAQKASSPLAGKIDALVRQVMEQHKIPGLQLTIVQHGSVVFTGAYGVANVEDDVPVTKETVFHINSMSKAFTGVAAMQLVEAGRLNLSEPVSTYLAGLPSAWQGITIQQLLTHTSGLPEITDDNCRLIGNGSFEDAWEKVQALPVQFAPGAQFAYTQTNYAVIAMVIEKITGEPFTRFIAERQFSVAGMNRTAYGDSVDVTPHVAALYTYLRLITQGTQTTGAETSTVLHTRYEPLPHYLRAAAGIETTSEDMARWVTALQESKLLEKKDSLDRLWTPQKAKDGTYSGFSDVINGYALGWPVVMRSKHPAISPIGGERAAMFIYPEDGLTVIVFTNLMGSSPQSFIEHIAGLFIPDL